MSFDRCLVRADRVGLYNRYGAWKYVPMQGPTFGDLWLTTDGTIGFNRPGAHKSEWEATVSAVKNVERVSASVYPWCMQLWPSASFEAGFAGKRYVVFFTGVTKFLSKGELALKHIPGGVGPLLVAMDAAVKNRGTKARGKQTLEVWLRLLKGEIEATDPVLASGLTAA
jgi:hypothetical protein